MFCTSNQMTQRLPGDDSVSRATTASSRTVSLRWICMRYVLQQRDPPPPLIGSDNWSWSMFLWDRWWGGAYRAQVRTFHLFQIPTRLIHKFFSLSYTTVKWIWEIWKEQHRTITEKLIHLQTSVTVNNRHVETDDYWFLVHERSEVLSRLTHFTFSKLVKHYWAKLKFKISQRWFNVRILLSKFRFNFIDRKVYLFIYKI